MDHNLQGLAENSTNNTIKQVRRVTIWGLVGNLTLCAIKFIFGILGHSQALIADAVHSLSDSSTDIVVLVGVKYWSAPADEDHPYGHGRIETVITFLIGTVLLGVGVGLIWKGLSSLVDTDAMPPSWLAFTAACISLISKEILYRWTYHVGKQVKSSALVANAWHHRSDALSSLPVAIAILGMKIQPTWYFLDHAATIIVSVLIMQAAWKICFPALCQLVDASVAKEQTNQIKTITLDTEGVLAAHAIRSRQTGSGIQVDLHVQVDPLLTVRQGHDIAREVKYQIRDRLEDVIDVLVHIEPYESVAEPDKANNTYRD